MPVAKSTSATKPSARSARAGEATTWRTSPRRHRPVTIGARSDRHGVGERPSQVADGVRSAAGDVVGAGLDVGPGEGGHVGPGHVVDVDEVPGLAAVLEHLRRLPCRQGAAKDRRHSRVGRVARHPRPVDVVVAEGDDGGPRLPPPQRAQVLLVELGGGVHVAGVEGRVLVDGGPAGRAAAAGPRGRSGRTGRRPGPRRCGARAARRRGRRTGSGPRRRPPCCWPAPAVPGRTASTAPPGGRRCRCRWPPRTHPRRRSRHPVPPWPPGGTPLRHRRPPPPPPPGRRRRPRSGRPRGRGSRGSSGGRPAPGCRRP